MTRKPLIYATGRAQTQAGSLLPPGKPLEVAVTEAIENGGIVVAGRHGGRVIGDSWVARFERRPGRLRPRPRSWVVLDVQPTDGGTR